MKISFCTTCMGRKEHLKETLIQNIRDNLPTKDGDPKVEFVVVDYNSPDKLREWIEGNEELQQYIKEGILVYRQYPKADKFHHAHAKNMAHRVATENADPAETEHIVCNMDADNFLGKGFARYLANEFAHGKHAFVHPAFGAHKNLPSGSYGRIALRTEDFLALGGYSETRFSKGWGGEDTDLVIRALAYGLEPRPIFNQDFLHAIAHGNEERIKNTAGGTTAQDLEKVHSRRITLKRVRFAFRTYASSVQANRDGHFGMGTVFGLDNKPQSIGAVESMPPVSRRNIHALLPRHRVKTMKHPAQTAGA